MTYTSDKREGRNLVLDHSDRIIDSCIVGLQSFTTEELREVAAEARGRSDESWLARMIDEYIETWRS